MRDSQRNQIPHLVVIPCLIMTFLLGPIGLLFYFAIRYGEVAKRECLASSVTAIRCCSGSAPR